MVNPINWDRNENWPQWPVGIKKRWNFLLFIWLFFFLMVFNNRIFCLKYFTWSNWRLTAKIMFEIQVILQKTTQRKMLEPEELPKGQSWGPWVGALCCTFFNTQAENSVCLIADSNREQLPVQWISGIFYLMNSAVSRAELSFHSFLLNLIFKEKRLYYRDYPTSVGKHLLLICFWSKQQTQSRTLQIGLLWLDEHLFWEVTMLGTCLC